MITVQELVDTLNKVQDKNKRILFFTNSQYIEIGDISEFIAGPVVLWEAQDERRESA